jgi:hypothetical protein
MTSPGESIRQLVRDPFDPASFSTGYRQAEREYGEMEWAD